jgi:hypothetical protein
MKKNPRVTISKANRKDKSNTHYVISVGGHGMTMAYTKEEALRKQKLYREQVQRKK